MCFFLSGVYSVRERALLPADDTARLVLASRLEEHEEEMFGRFVRAGATDGPALVVNLDALTLEAAVPRR
jgi:uncharacterized protein (TIGR02996 family)